MLLEMKTRLSEPDILVIELAGRITLGRESTHIQDTVVKAVNDGVRKIVMDIANVHHIDSAGLGILVFSAGTLSKQGGKFLLAGANGHALEVLQMTHLDSVIPFSPSAELACATMAGEG